MGKRIRVGVFCGGRSAEHEVSLQSAKNIMEAMDREKYEVVVIGIDKKGEWHLHDCSGFLAEANDPKLVRLNQAGERVTPVPYEGGARLIKIAGTGEAGTIDVAFPVLHGPFGEDGTIQGLLKLADIPFVGAGVLGSAIGMDKDVAKRLLRDAGIPVAAFRCFEKGERQEIHFEEVSRDLGLPLFVKPVNLGSSVGISKVRDREQFEKALQLAFEYDTKVLIEEYIKGREIECSVLGNDRPIASLPGEVLPRHEFYSYEAKYIDEKGAILKIPADLSREVTEAIRDLAVRAFKVLCCQGMARVDFFLRNDKEVLVNEINTIPGFTKISMYPKLWEATGIGYSELIDHLIRLAVERSAEEKRLKTSYGARNHRPWDPNAAQPQPE